MNRLKPKRRTTNEIDLLAFSHMKGGTSVKTEGRLRAKSKPELDLSVLKAANTESEVTETPDEVPQDTRGSGIRRMTDEGIKKIFISKASDDDDLDQVKVPNITTSS